jgi:NAD(P) transhydrogenase subunit alpha
VKTIGLLKEKTNDKRVCLLPEAIQKLTKQGVKVLFETNAAASIGILDSEYKKAGAICATSEKIYKTTDLICSISHCYDNEKLSDSPSFIGIFNPLFHKKELDKYPNNTSLYSLDLLPRTTIAQRMDVLSSMASLSGYKAVLLATNQYHDAVPMFTTAAGTIKPARFLILGAGVAGLQAIATAKRLGGIVEAFDVRSSAAEEVRSLGAKFIEVRGFTETKDAGGYAVTQTEEFQQKQQELIHQCALQANIIICTANIPGKKAPILLKKETVSRMKQGAVIIDLASEQGGNCELTINNSITIHNNVSITGDSHLTKQLPIAASKLLSNNYLNYVQYFLNTMDSDLITQTKVLHKGKIVHPRLQ